MEDNVDVAAALRRSVGALHRLLVRSERGALTPAQLSLLATVEAHGPLRPGELAAREQVTSSTVTRSVTWAVERGLVRQSVDGRDRRASLIEITPAGSVLLASLRAKGTAEFAQRLRRLSAAERKVLAEGLAALEPFFDGRAG
ncbi:MarR family transcriptional regulator [Solwaraspora sp. WMMD1047]|uniref:MarR family winged helix-turn-helix transcriptional regulator n=1 Tax=Solwaraspora sp. WMMD1047 TaxID=3016102 RepID=UPI002417300F|nr:MarR family transcriptional regulator [Solwaraspora sp. WMMD1047]MDG4834360.1 MarR family transcriptional regulator [Solwaraspora sp. WMMD1047]